MKKKTITQIAHKPIIKIGFSVFLLVTAFGILNSKAQDDSYQKLKQMAKMQDTIKSQQSSKILVTTANPFFKINSKKPIEFKPFPMIDKNGRQIPPNEMVALPNGTRMTAKEYFAKLNDLEQKFNAEGYSLRDNKKVITSEIVTPKSDLEGRFIYLPKPVSALKSKAELEKFLDPTFKVGTMQLAPLGSYKSPSDRKKIQESLIEDLGNGNFQITPLKTKLNANTTLPSSQALLKTINETTKQDQHFGNASSFLAGMNESFTLNAKLYGTDLQHPSNNLSEYKISGSGKIYASIFDHSFDVFNADAELYVPADSSKKMSVKVVSTVVGINILNIDEKYMQRQIITKSNSRNFDKQFAISVPIVGPINFDGLVGIRGTLGYKCDGELDRTLLRGEIRTFANIEGYAEAGLSVPVVGEVGVHLGLTFIKGDVDLSASLGVINDNRSQIAVGVVYNFSYDVDFLRGRLSVFYRAGCLPHVGCLTEAETPIFSWTGKEIAGTFADKRYPLIIPYPLPTVKTGVPK